MRKRNGVDDIMEYNKWKDYYNQILLDFGFSREKDEKSAKLLSKMIEKKNVVKIQELKKIISNKYVYVFGAGASLKNNIKKTKDTVFFSAGSTTSQLMEKDVVPDIVVTDLDGTVDDQVAANKKGGIAVVHAHGDNMQSIKKYLPMFDGKIIGTTPSKPFGNLYNFGGFTDGDRAVFLADHFGAKKIFLAGFDFENVGKYSLSKKIKMKKLKWAKKLIEKIDRVYFV